MTWKVMAGNSRLCSSADPGDFSDGDSGDQSLYQHAIVLGSHEKPFGQSKGSLLVALLRIFRRRQEGKIHEKHAPLDCWQGL